MNDELTPSLGSEPEPAPAADKSSKSSGLALAKDDESANKRKATYATVGMIAGVAALIASVALLSLKKGSNAYKLVNGLGKLASGIGIFCNLGSASINFRQGNIAEGVWDVGGAVIGVIGFNLEGEKSVMVNSLGVAYGSLGMVIFGPANTGAKKPANTPNPMPINKPKALKETPKPKDPEPGSSPKIRYYKHDEGGHPPPPAPGSEPKKQPPPAKAPKTPKKSGIPAPNLHQREYSRSKPAVVRLRVVSARPR